MVDYPYTHYLDPSVFVWGQSLPNYPIKCVKRIKRALSLALFAIYYFCQSTSPCFMFSLITDSQLRSRARHILSIMVMADIAAGLDIIRYTKMLFTCKYGIRLRYVFIQSKLLKLVLL